jgi:peptide/nickel transport system permease protein
MPPGTPGIVASDAERRELPVWRLLLRRPTFVTGALILLFWVVCAIFGTSIAPHSPLAQQLLATNQAPSGAHWFGTDQLGRDMLSRVIVGARTMLIVAPLATVVGTVLGTALGLALGYLGGVVDLLASRVIEGVLALPALLVIFLFMVPLGVTTLSQVLVIGFIFTPLIARTVRSAVQVERQLDYVPAARLLGERSGWMMFVEILPNVVPTILVEFTVRLGYAVFAVASLAFLGFGVQLSTPNWGTDINANYVVLGAGYWWESLFPALAIASLIIGINLVADSVEQVVVG